MKAFGRYLVAALATAAALAGVARADDEKDTSGRLYTWTVMKDGKDVIGSETLRLVDGEGGALFASGETILKTGRKLHRKSHLQRDASGHLVKYQRVEAGLKGAGVRVFEWQGQMRVAPINANGKPADVGTLASARIFDEDLWHLYQTWGLPKSCQSARLAYFDPGKRTAGEATLTCTGQKKVWDDKQRPIEARQFEVSGVAGEAVELWVDDQGGLVGGKSGSRWMLRTKYSLEPGKDAANGGGDDTEQQDKDAIRERGVGE